MKRKAKAPPARVARARGTFVRAAVALLSVLCIVAVGAPGASADPTFVGTFSTANVPGGSIGITVSSKLAVDEQTGDVYVIDATDGVVDKFDSNGNYISQITGASTAAQTFGFASNGFNDIAVDNSGGAGQGDVYVFSRGAPRTIFAFDSSGTERWEAPDPASSCGLGVDQSGHPWVGGFNPPTAVQLSPVDGSPTGTTIDEGSAHCHLAFDNDNAVYMTNLNSGLDKYNPSLAIDDGSGHQYAAVATSFLRNDIFAVSANNGTPVLSQWDKTGAQLSSLTGSGVTDSYTGVALDGRRNRLYVSDVIAGVIQMYTVPPQPPALTVSAAAPIGIHEATLNGTVNPNGNDVTDCHFAYGTQASGTFDQTVPCTPAAPISGVAAVPVRADVSGLSPNTDYQFELVATNGGGTTISDPVLFRTLVPPPPVAVTGAASSITQTGATVAGTVNPSGDATTCVIEYGTTTSYGASVPCSSSPGAGSSPVDVGATLSGLSPNTDYHYRVTATNSGGSASGADGTFRTLQTPPTCATDASLCPRTCPEDLSKCQPPTVKLAGFSGTTLLLRLSCTGFTGQTCSGKLTFKATIKVRVKHGKKTRIVKRTITVATVSYSIGAGSTSSIKLKLTSAAKTALKSGGLTAKAGSFSIKLPKTKVRRAKKRH